MKNIWYIRRMVSSAMLRRAALVRTDVSEELSASIIRAKRIVVLSSPILIVLMMEELSSSQTSVLIRATRHPKRRYSL
jgi:hypothetical protein